MYCSETVRALDKTLATKMTQLDNPQSPTLATYATSSVVVGVEVAKSAALAAAFSHNALKVLETDLTIAVAICLVNHLLYIVVR